MTQILTLMRHGDLLDTELTGLGSRTGWGYCVMFLGMTLYSHSVFFRDVNYTQKAEKRTA